MLTGLSRQVILCTKEVSVGARKNAFALLVEMGHAFLRFGPNQEGEAWVTWGWDGCSAPSLGSLGLGWMLCSQLGEEAPLSH